MRRCVFEDLFSLDQPHRFSRWKTATYDRTALTNNERNNTPFNRMEKQFLTRYFFKDSPVHPNIHFPPFPPINPLLIFVDYFFTLDDQLINVMTIRLNHEGLPPLPVNLVLDRKDRLKPYLPPFITRGSALLTCFPYSQPKTIRVDDINHLYKGSIVLSFNPLIYKLIPNLFVSVGHIAIPPYILQNPFTFPLPSTLPFFSESLLLILLRLHPKFHKRQITYFLHDTFLLYLSSYTDIEPRLNTWHIPEQNPNPPPPEYILIDESDSSSDESHDFSDSSSIFSIHSESNSSSSVSSYIYSSDSPNSVSSHFFPE
jgi:hypothetical protein